MPSISGWRPRIAALLSTSALGLLASAAAANPAPPYQDLVRAGAAAPSLQEAEAAVAQAQGLARQAATRPNPTVGLTVENFGGTGPYRVVDAAETTASIEQRLELGGKRGARVQAAQAEIASAQARGVQTRATFIFELAQAYVAAEAADRRQTLAAENLQLAQEDGRVADALVRAGKEADVRAVQARAALRAAQADVEEATATRAAAFARLTAAAGASELFTSLSSSLLSHADRSEAFISPDPMGSPAIAAAQAAREAAARRVRVERTRSTPDVDVSFGVRRLSVDQSTAFVAGVSVPLPISDRNQGSIAAAQAELRGAEARLRIAELDAQAESRSGAARASAAQARILAARQGEAAAAEAYQLTRLGYEGGKLPLSEVLAARRALADARAQTLNAQVDRLNAEAALARLAGAVPFGDQP